MCRVASCAFSRLCVCVCVCVGGGGRTQAVLAYFGTVVMHVVLGGAGCRMDRVGSRVSGGVGEMGSVE
jgi:hypothetical protein